MPSRHSANRLKVSPCVILQHSLDCPVLTAAAQAPDYEREKRWSDQILPGRARRRCGLAQAEERPRVPHPLHRGGKTRVARRSSAHGRGWNPDYELYGTLRTKLAEPATPRSRSSCRCSGRGAKVGDYIPTYPDARGALCSWPPTSCKTRATRRLRSCRTAWARRWRTSTSSTPIHAGQGLGVHRHHQRTRGDVPHQDSGARRVRQQRLGNHAGRGLRAQETDS